MTCMLRRGLTPTLVAMVVGVLAALLVVFPSIGTAHATENAPRTGAGVEAEASLDTTGILTAGLDDFTFLSLDADYTLTRDELGASHLRVVETFIANFPDVDQNQGMSRAIPDSYNGQPLNPTLVSIADENGEPRAQETDSDDGTFLMTSDAGQYVYGPQTYVFTYDLENVTWSFPGTETEEFYWDVNGVDWPQPFDLVSARVHMEGDLAEALTGENACYVGLQGAVATCDITTAASTADSSAPRATVSATASGVGPRQSMTIAIGFVPATFVLYDTSYFGSPWGWAQLIGFLALIAAFVWVIAARARYLRDAPGRPTIIAEYTPPRSVDALESAVLLGKSARAIPAEVLQQAIVGSIHIVEGKKKRFGADKLKAVLVDASLADHDGTMLLKGLFGASLVPGAEFTFGGENTRFAKASQKILVGAAKALQARGFRRVVPARGRGWPIAATLSAAVVVMVTGIIALASWVSSPIPVLAIVVAAVAVILALGILSKKPLTATGAEVRDHLRGLQMFIEWAEADRIRMLQSPKGAERIETADAQQMLRLYEALLPYAVVFGHEKQWAERLAVYYRETGNPIWYAGAGAFNAGAFSAGIGTLSAVAVSSSSSSGGSRGGGSAGGGGGGGGGGGV